MITDCHVHSRGREKGEDVLKALDQAGIDRVCLFAPYPGDDESKQRESTQFISKLQAVDPDRIFGFAWIEPKIPSAPDAVSEAVEKYGVRGVKMIPHHWYPYDELLVPVFERIQSAGVPIIFHSGILFGFMDSSRFCRPCGYEALLHFPKIKFALSHIGWPWTDECLATAGRFRAAVHRKETPSDMQMHIDLCPGTPPAWREDALRKAIAYLGDELLIYGSDHGSPDNPEAYLPTLRADQRLFSDVLGLTQASQDRIFGTNVEKLFSGGSD
jgi:predicted TIM-barrel fold metal-dependent hydrolase